MSQHVHFAYQYIHLLWLGFIVLDKKERKREKACIIHYYYHYYSDKLLTFYVSIFLTHGITQIKFSLLPFSSYFLFIQIIIFVVTNHYSYQPLRLTKYFCFYLHNLKIVSMLVHVCLRLFFFFFNLTYSILFSCASKFH